jgi:hypothetical protein
MNARSVPILPYPPAGDFLTREIEEFSGKQR